jgi:hypothetical protein
MTLNEELEEMLKEPDVACLKYYLNLPDGTEGNKNPCIWLAIRFRYHRNKKRLMNSLTLQFAK